MLNSSAEIDRFRMLEAEGLESVQNKIKTS